jgi:hypothetical protein
MRFWFTVIISISMLLALACSRPTRTLTPLDTFKSFNAAVKKKDLTSMKLLLSAASLKMHEEEAKSRGVTLDDVMKTQSLIGENQTSVGFKNEKIEGDRATIEVKDQNGRWDTIHFVMEDGVWKIDELGSAEQMIKEIEQQQQDAFKFPPAVTPAATP